MWKCSQHRLGRAGCLGNVVHFSDFGLSVLVHIITHLCDCMWECIMCGALARMHTYLHTFYTRTSPHSCRPQPVCVCVCGCLRVFHAQHCLLETLSKSPQCDNWLPGVLVSLLLIIVIPCRKKKKRESVIGEVCLFVGETDPKSAWTLLARTNFEAMRQRGQIRCSSAAGCSLLSWHQGLVFISTWCHGGS